VTPQVYAKARAEVLGLFGWGADTLSPDQMLRLDCATALRLALDDLQGRVIRGEAIDMNRMLTASEALSRLLPPAVLAAPPAEKREDPREAFLRMYFQMRARSAEAEEGYDGLVRKVERLQAELEQLRGGPAPAEPRPPMPLPPNVGVLSRPAPVATPVPSTPTAEERQQALARANAPVPESIRDSRPKNEPWHDFTHGGAGFDRWSNRNF
jgi:hypothetical protein